MATYRIQGRTGGATGVSIDQSILVDSDELAIAMAKNYPIMPGDGYADWGCLTNEAGEVLWEVGTRA